MVTGLHSFAALAGQTEAALRFVTFILEPRVVAVRQDGKVERMEGELKLTMCHPKSEGPANALDSVYSDRTMGRRRVRSGGHQSMLAFCEAVQLGKRLCCSTEAEAIEIARAKIGFSHDLKQWITVSCLYSQPDAVRLLTGPSV